MIGISAPRYRYLLNTNRAPFIGPLDVAVAPPKIYFQHPREGGGIENLTLKANGSMAFAG
jgi:hypothetical protein